jgi:PBSX family phage terminase large subunit
MNLRQRSSARRGYPSRQPKPEWINKGKLGRARQSTAIRQARDRCLWDYEFRGNMGTPFAEAIKTHEEILLCGAAGTGKTLRILHFLNEVCWNYPKARILIVRKVRADLAQSTLVTYERDVMGQDNPIVSNVQRQYRLSYKYPNGSEVVVGGMDRPGAILSAEYDVIYAPEAVQLELSDWETLLMRLRAGPYPHPILIGDTNPGPPDHWLKQRVDAGLVLMLNTYHKDNPSWWSEKLQEWTAKGINYVLGKLARLTGVRKKRYLENKWASAEGAVYEDFNEDIHLINEVQLPEFQRRFRSIDFGFRNPFVCQWWGEDYDKRLYLYREIYQTGLLVADAAIEIVRLEAGLSLDEVAAMKAKYKDYADEDGRFWRELRSLARAREKIDGSVADHDAEDRATLDKYGISTVAAKKAVHNGIQAVQARLRVQEDRKPSLFVVRGARVTMDMALKDAGKPTSTQEEISGYVWNDATKKEEPIKVDDHGQDAKRYMVMYFDDPEDAANKAVIRESRIEWGRTPFGKKGRR